MGNEFGDDGFGDEGMGDEFGDEGMGADLIGWEQNFAGEDSMGADLIGSLLGADLIGADLIGADMAALVGAGMQGQSNPNLMRAAVMTHKTKQLARVLHHQNKVLKRKMHQLHQRMTGQCPPGTSLPPWGPGGRVRFKDTPPTNSRELAIPFDSGPVLIPAGAAVTVSAQPQTKFRGERITIGNSISPNFSIDDLKVGKDSQFSSPGSHLAEVFSSTAFGVRMLLDTATPGILISFSVTNISGAGARFRATIFGLSAQ